MLLGAAGFPAVAASVSGVVTDSRSRPVAGATVHLVEKGSHYGAPEDLEPLEQTETGSRGDFRLAGPDSTTVPLALLVSAPGLEKVMVPVGGEGENRMDVRLGRGVELAGVVTDEKGHPVAGATVGPLAVADDSETPGAGRIAPQWTQAGSDGSFVMQHVAPEERYSLQVSAPGFETATLAVQWTGRPLEVRLRRGGSAFGGELHGTGMLPHEHKGTTVLLSQSGTVLTSRADAEGRFSFSGVPAGEYSLQAVPRPPRVGQTQSLVFPDDDGTSVLLKVSGGYYVEGTAVDWETSTPAAGVPLHVNGLRGVSGSDGRFRVGPFYRPGFVQISLPESEAPQWRLYPESRENPRPLREAEGFEDVRDVEVRLLPRRTLQVRVLNWEVSTGPLALHLLGGGHGERQVALTTSPMTITLEHLGRQWGYARGEGLVSDLREFEVTTGSLLPRINPPSDRAGELVLFLQPEARLKGLAVRAAAGETTGTPAADCQVSLSVAGSGESGSKPALVSQALTDSDGRFLLNGLPAAEFDCTVVTPSRGQEITHRVVLRPGSNQAPDFIFRTGQNFSGEVLDEEGTPVAGALLHYYARTGELSTKQGQMITDSSGRFAAEDILGSSVDLLQITHSDFVPHEEKGIALPAQGLRYTLRRQQGLQFQVNAPEDTVWLVQLMRADPWGQPPYAEQLFGQAIAKTSVPGGKPGDFRPTDNATYYLVARGPLNGLAVSQAVVWNRERAARKEMIVLDPRGRGRIEGQLADAPGETVQVAATNTWLPERAAPDEVRVIAEGGRFTMPDLIPGNYLLVAEGESYAASAMNIEVAPGASVSVTLRPAALNDVNGIVVLEGRPVAGAEVRLISQTVEGSPAETAVTDSEGRFSFSSVGPDTYLAQAALKVEPGEGGGEALQAQRSVKVGHEEQEVNVELDLTRPRMVRFELPGGNSAPSVTLTNLETRETVAAQWKGDAFEAPARPGLYEISRGDAVVGKARVEPGGAVQMVD